MTKTGFIINCTINAVGVIFLFINPRVAALFNIMALYTWFQFLLCVWFPKDLIEDEDS